ncbi:MAG: hypothetical protein EOO11_17520 [Chitinophagaceae bacterium]|nr:MAG: hypothetical protein EOO11_17520 [Chitinophagaceae bacterium]
MNDQVTPDPILLTDPATAERFVATTHIDQHVHVPARRPARCYYGMISAITPDAAERAVRFGVNWIAEKPAAPASSDEEEENP